MKQKIAGTRRLRGNRASALVALLAMLMQILFTAEHVSAMARAAANGGADGSPMGFLDICTARGLIRIPAPLGTGTDLPPAPRTGGGGESCAVCGTAAVSGASDIAVSVPVIDHPHLFQVTVPVPAKQSLASSGPKRSGTTRGPPIC